MLEEKPTQPIRKSQVFSLERHGYAPELNTLWLKNNLSYRAPHCYTINEAIAYVNKKYFS